MSKSVELIDYECTIAATARELHRKFPGDSITDCVRAILLPPLNR